MVEARMIQRLEREVQGASRKLLEAYTGNVKEFAEDMGGLKWERLLPPHTSIALDGFWLQN